MKPTNNTPLTPFLMSDYEKAKAAGLTQKELVLTLDEIAEKFGVPVEKIRVKK